AGAHPVLQRRLLLPVEMLVAGAEIAPRPDVHQREDFAMQPVGAPVGRDIAAMPPDGAELHAAHRLPDLATLLDVRSRVDDIAAVGHHLLRHRRRILVNLVAAPQQDAEGNRQKEAQQAPEFLGAGHRHVSSSGPPATCGNPSYPDIPRGIAAAAGQAHFSIRSGAPGPEDAYAGAVDPCAGTNNCRVDDRRSGRTATESRMPGRRAVETPRRLTLSWRRAGVAQW